MKHPSGFEAIQFAEYMGFNLGSAFVALWKDDLEPALASLERYYEQRGPLPQVEVYAFREATNKYRAVFNRPCPWCESIRFAMAIICDLCASPSFGERGRLCERAIMCVKTAIADNECRGRGMEA